MNKIWQIVTIVSLVIILLLSGQVNAERVAVLNFETDGMPWTDDSEFEQEILKGITREFSEKLHEDGSFEVIDNSRVSNVLDQAGYRYGDTIDSTVVPHISRSLENNLLILGSVNKLTVAEVGEISVGPVTLSGIEAEVELSARLIDANTGNTILTYSGSGKTTEGGLEIDELEGVSFGTEAFADSAVGKAITEAISDMTRKVVAEEDMIFDHHAKEDETTEEVVVEGEIIDTIGNSLVLNIGEEDGLEEGIAGNIVRVIDSGGDDPMTVTYGEVEISSVDDRTSIASVVNSEEEPELEDLVQVNLSDSGSVRGSGSAGGVIETVETEDFIVYIESAVRSRDEVTVSGTVEAKNEAELTIFITGGFEFYDHEGQKRSTWNRTSRIGEEESSSIRRTILPNYPQMISWTFGDVPEDADHLSRLRLYFRTESVGEVEINLDGIDLTTY